MVVEIASRYLNLTEVKSNQEWDLVSTPGKDWQAQEFKDGIISIGGHQDGWAYCMSSSKFWYIAALRQLQTPENIVQEYNKLLNVSVVKSYTNCLKAGKIVKPPSIGSIFFMQKGNSGFGHAGICTSEGNPFSTIEANTSANPTSADQDREGQGIFTKKRKLNFSKTSGLYLLGFLPPIS